MSLQICIDHVVAIAHVTLKMPKDAIKYMRFTLHHLNIRPTYSMTVSFVQPVKGLQKFCSLLLPLSYYYCPVDAIHVALALQAFLAGGRAKGGAPHQSDLGCHGVTGGQGLGQGHWPLQLQP